MHICTPKGFPVGSNKESACNAGDLCLIPGSGRSLGEGNGYPLQYSCLENSMDRGAWGATVHRVAESRTQLAKVCIVEAMVFPVLMYRCESLTVKKGEHQRIVAFELWCWKKLLTVPWTARRSNQSILKEINPESSMEGLMLKLKLQSFGHLM